MCKIMSCESYQNARKKFPGVGIVSGRALLLFRTIEYFFILQYFQKISDTGSLSEERYFGM